MEDLHVLIENDLQNGLPSRKKQKSYGKFKYMYLNKQRKTTVNGAVLEIYARKLY